MIPRVGVGQGMVLQPEPLHAAISELKKENTHVILMTPQGAPLKQARVRELSSEAHLLIVCGHYEGVDHRIIESLIDEEISIGDYVLTNGAIAAAVLCDAVVRLLPGALGDAQSAIEESFSDPDLLEAPCYTRPVDFMGKKSRKSCFLGTMEKSQNGGRRKLSNAPKETDPISKNENSPDPPNSYWPLPSRACFNH